ncbi:MAG: MBL fold metallo-hydrolase [Gemmatimonadetes bacterium]|nr:MBL fold metallo-hydrolase [Gemmatimonadota bacterium]
MLLKRFYHEGLAQASYLLGCQRTGEAIVIDPNRDPAPYLAAAAAEGMRITQVTETHIHADYLSGSRELAHAAGARLLLSAMGTADWQYAFAAADGARLLRHGDEIRVGNLRLDVVHTPGHTPEHIVFVCTDTPASAHPVGVFSGDFLFVGDVGRPDLLERAANVAGTMRAGAAQLFDSIQAFTATYPDFLQVWPGHGSGSACGKALGAVPSTTLGYEKVANWALRHSDRAAFIEAVLHGQPDPPRYFAMMKRLNKEGPRILGARPLPLPRPASALHAALASGHRVIDIRPAAAYAERHVRGTINIPFNTSFVTWAGWLVPYDQPFHLLTDGGDASAQSAVAELAMIGLDDCSGWFGQDALAAATATIPQVDASALHASTGAQVVDVRAVDEYEVGHLAGATHIPLGRLEARLGELDAARPVVLQCQGGGRSSIAASLLEARGFTNVANLAGGYTAWVAAGLPVESVPGIHA